MVVKIEVLGNIPFPLRYLNRKIYKEVELYKTNGDYCVLTEGTIEIYDEYIETIIENTPRVITRLDNITEWVLS